MNKSRIEIIDYMKAIAIIFVIFDHIGIVSTNNFFYCFFIRMAVPIFMTLSGYTFCVANERKESLKELYELKKIFKNIVRFIFPALLSCIFVMIWEPNNKSLFKTFIMGGYGPGSYYPILMVQFVFVCPLLYRYVKDRKSILVTIFLCIFFEILTNVLHMNPGVYRILLYRYIIYIVGGMIIYRMKDDISIRVKFSIFICGVLYIIMIKEGYKPVIFKSWSNTAMPVAMYVVPIVYTIIRKYYFFSIKNIVGNILGTIGKASYHILFAQIIMRKLWEQIGNDSFVSVVSICLFSSLILGVMLWKIEDKFIFKKFIK